MDNNEKPIIEVPKNHTHICVYVIINSVNGSYCTCRECGNSYIISDKAFKYSSM